MSQACNVPTGETEELSGVLSAQPRRYRRYPEYRDSGVEWLGQVPGHWEIKKLKALSSLQTGLTLGKRYEEEFLELRPYLRVANVQDGHLALNDIAEIALPHGDVRRYELRNGDVLMTEGGDFDKLGRGYVWQGQIQGCLHQNHIFAVRPNQAQLDSWFLSGLLGSAYGRAYFTATSKQSTNLASTNSTKLKNLPVPLPPAPEQREIVDFLERETSKVDALIAKKERLIGLLHEKRSALITRAVTKGLDPNAAMKDSGFDILGQVPSHWRAGPLRHWWSITDCKHRTPQYTDVGYPVISTTEVKPGSLDLGAARNFVSQTDFVDLTGGGRLPRRGDIIYSRNASLGAAAYVETDEPFTMGQDVVLIRSRDQDQRYLTYVLNSPLGNRQVELACIGSTFKRINVSQIGKQLVPVPPRAEQLSIADMLERSVSHIDVSAARIQQGISYLRELRSALITAAVTGKIDVREEVA